MGDVHPITNAGTGLVDTPTYPQQEVLERAIVKLVLLGQQVGVSSDQMILLLKSGLTVAELVEYLALLNEGRVCD